jgi:3'(2'), 5'-bisphosphate nucleotidase
VDVHKELEAALAAAGAAAQVCRRVQETFLPREVVLKPDRSPVTVADFGAQAVINHLLGAAFPDIPVVGEEHAGALRCQGELRRQVVEAVASVLPDLGEAEVLAAIDRGDFGGGSGGRFWAVDPIDGTKGFLRRQQYAVAIALVDGGEVMLGVLACPALPWALPEAEPMGCVLAATRGGGAWMQRLGGGPRESVAVASETDPRRAVLCESVEAEHSSHTTSAEVAQRLGVRTAPVRMDSQCKYALLARGDASVYLRLPSQAEYREKVWDHAAGAILVEEAGGRVSDLEGRALDFARGRTLASNRGVIATNGYLHDAVLAAVRAVVRGG